MIAAQPTQQAATHAGTLEDREHASEMFSVTFKDGSCLDIQMRGMDSDDAGAYFQLLKQMLLEEKDEVPGDSLKEDVCDNESLLPFAACADCGDVAVGEVLLPSGITLPFCLDCTSRRVKD